MQQVMASRTAATVACRRRIGESLDCAAQIGAACCFHGGGQIHGNLGNCDGVTPREASGLVAEWSVRKICVMRVQSDSACVPLLEAQPPSMRVVVLGMQRDFGPSGAD